MKIESNSNKFITKMISEKISTNPESFTGFGRGRRIDWRYPMDTPLYILKRNLVYNMACCGLTSIDQINKDILYKHI